MRIYGNINSYTGRSGTTTRLQYSLKRRSSATSSKSTSASTATDLYSLLNKSTSTNSSTSTSSTVVSETYEKIGTTAGNVATHSSKLLATGESDLFDEDEKNSDNAVKEIKRFVEDFNSLMGKMQKSGSNTYKTFYKELKLEATSSKESLEEVGIMCKADGTLTVDEDKLENAKLSDLKKIFQGKEGFCAKVNEKAYTIKKRATLDTAISSYTGNTSKTSYSKSV